MRETCFCGRTGDIADREPVYLGDGVWGLACPDCGHLDRLELFPQATRHIADDRAAWPIVVPDTPTASASYAFGQSATYQTDIGDLLGITQLAL